MIWVLTFANILGPRVVGALETWTMSLALVPILGIAFLGWFWFDKATFLAGWNASGGTDVHAVSRAASMALWAFMGIESAAVSAGVIENPKRNIPLATLMGLGLAAVVYVLSSSVIMGIIPNAELQKSHAPFAEAARLAVGTWGMVVISLCAILKSVGSLGGWMLLVGQSAKAAADDGMFPTAFARLNRHGVPGRGLVIVGVLMTIVLFATMSPTLAGQFSLIIDIAVVLAVVPYIYSVGGGGQGRLRPPSAGANLPDLQVDRDRGGRLLPVGGGRRRPQDGGLRDGGPPRERSPLPVLHPLDGSRREAEARTEQRSHPCRHSVRPQGVVSGSGPS